MNGGKKSFSRSLRRRRVSLLLIIITNTSIITRFHYANNIILHLHRIKKTIQSRAEFLGFLCYVVKVRLSLSSNLISPLSKVFLCVCRLYRNHIFTSEGSGRNILFFLKKSRNINRASFLFSP